MEDENSWQPPWDCGEDADEQINLSSPFRDSNSHSFRFVPVNGHPDFTTAKKHLHFNDDNETFSSNTNIVERPANSEIMDKQEHIIKPVKVSANVETIKLEYRHKT